VQVTGSEFVQTKLPSDSRSLKPIQKLLCANEKTKSCSPWSFNRHEVAAQGNGLGLRRFPDLGCD
jgi:hypothetical protein